MDFLSLAILALLAILGVVVILLAWNQSGLRRELQNSQKQSEQMMNELKALYSGAAGQVNHIARLEAQLNKLSDKQEQMDSTDPVNQGYSEAIQMVQRGGTVEDLMRRGLRREEAELLIRLHGQQHLVD